MDETVDIAGTEYEASAKLERIFPQTVLARADQPGALAGLHVVAAEKVQQVGFFQAKLAISHALVVNEQRERDVAFVAEQAGVIDIAQADGRQPGATLLKLRKVLAQLRDVFAAEDSTIVPEKDDHRGRISPQGTEMNGFAINVRQRDGGESCAIALSHGATLSCAQGDLSRLNRDSVFVIQCRGTGGSPKPPIIEVIARNRKTAYR